MPLGINLALWQAALQGGGGVTFDFYADSVAGNDSNSGTSAAQAFQTLSALRTAALAFGNNVRVGLKRGSVWRAQLDLSTLTGVMIGLYGDAGDPPVIDASEVLSSWTKTGGFTNLYHATMVESKKTGNVRYAVWRNNVPLTNRASQALADANAGSSFVDTSGANAIVYVHAPGSANPASDGGVYESMARWNGADLSGVNVTGSHQPGGRVEGVHFRRNLHDNGAVMVGSGASLKKALAYQGTYHNAFIGDGIVEDLICFDKHAIIASGAMLVAYFNGADSKTLDVKRYFAKGVPDSGTFEAVEGFFCHVDGGGQYSQMNFEGFACIDMSGSLDFANVAALNLTGGYLKNTAAPQTPTVAAIIDCIQFNGVYISTARWINPGSTLRNIASYNGSPFGIFVGTTIENSSFRHTIGPGSQLSTSMTYNKNVNISDGSNPNLRVTKAGYVGNHNIYYTPVDTRTVWFIDEASANFFTLASWFAATGQDQHSVRLTAAQLASFWLGNPSLGDFRINPSAQVTDKDGNVLTGVFPDGTPLTEAGPQFHWDYNQRAKVAGAPTAWPAIPETLANSVAYISDPEGWDFYS